MYFPSPSRRFRDSEEDEYTTKKGYNRGKMEVVPRSHVTVEQC